LVNWSRSRLRGLVGVSPDVRERVTAAARLVGYRPNKLAQSLVVGRTQAIGVLLPTPHGNSYFLGVIEAIHQCARELLIAI
jgi:LacI family transcriptional regulator